MAGLPSFLNSALVPFLRAVLYGGLAGGAPFMVLTVPTGIAALANGEFAGGLLIALAPALIAGGATLACMLLAGLPLTYLLHKSGRESRKTYTLWGLGLGFGIPTLLGLLSGGGGAILFLSLPGALAGLAAGWVWGDYREDQTLSTGGDVVEVFE